jgi:hypothetical protein
MIESALRIWPCQPKTIALTDVFSGDYQVKSYSPSTAEKDRFPPPDLQHMRNTIGRVAPWVPAVYLVPKLIGADGRGVGGVCMNSDLSIIITVYAGTTISPANIYRTLSHELFHAIQPKILQEFKCDFYDHI